MDRSIYKDYVQRLIPCYSDEIWKMIDTALEPPGKAFRSCIATEIAKELDSSITIPASILARLELLHYFTLIHDDIIDRSEKRRGFDSVWKQYSPEIAVLLGDLFHACVFNFDKDNIDLPPDKMFKLLAQFSTASAKVQQGQILEMTNLFNQSLSLNNYFKTAILKTSSLIYLSSYIGWCFASEDLNVLRKLRTFSTPFGIAFQTYNDILDFRDNHGKKAYDDIRAGVMTLPVILYLRQQKSERITSSKYKLEDFVKSLEDSGALEAAADYCLSFCTKTEHRLDEALGKETAINIRKIIETFKSDSQLYKPMLTMVYPGTS